MNFLGATISTNRHVDIFAACTNRHVSFLAPLRTTHTTQCTQAQGTIRKAEQHLMSSAELFPRHATYLGLDTANGRIALTSHRTRPPPLLHMMMMTVTGCTVFQLPSAKKISSNGRYTRLTRISYTRNRPEADQPPGG